MTGVDDPVGFIELCVGSAAITNATEAGSKTTRHAGHAVPIHEMTERLTAALRRGRAPAVGARR